MGSFLDYKSKAMNLQKKGKDKNGGAQILLKLILAKLSFNQVNKNGITVLSG